MQLLNFRHINIHLAICLLIIKFFNVNLKVMKSAKEDVMT